MTLRALWLAVGIILPAAAGACEANWRAAQVVLGAAGLELVDAEGDLAIAAGEACRVASPSMRLRGETRMAARSLTWRTSQRNLAGSTLLLDVQVRGLTLDAGAGDDMASHLAEVMSLARPTDLMMTLTWAEEAGRIELRTRSGSFRPSIWASAVLNDTGPPGDDAWWAGFETASLREVTARLYGEGVAERVALSLLALDRLRGEGDPAPRLAALQDVIGNEIDGLPGETIDPVSRAALADALADLPDSRGTIDLTARWANPLNLASILAGVLAGRPAGAPRVEVSYAR